MSKEKNQKIKLLYLWDILINETDEMNHLTTQDLIEKLSQKNIPVNRKTLYQDIQCLNSFGYEVIQTRGKMNEYYIVNRPFDIVELRILRDAIHSAKFITEKKTKELTEKISLLAGKPTGQILKQSLVTHNAVKHTNEHIYYNTDTIHTCLQENCKVSFLYFDYSCDGKKSFRKEKKRYVVNPIELVLSEENYYLICCTDKYKNIISFRVDRMIDVKKEEEKVIDTECINLFDVNEYKKEVFNMYGGKTATVTIEAENSLTNVIMDKFGENVYMKKTDDTHFSVEVDVQLSPTFYSWCFIFGNKLKVVAPCDVVLLIKERLSDLQKCYNL